MMMIVIWLQINPTKVVGENMKALEVAEGKALEREEKFKEQVMVMKSRWK